MGITITPLNSGFCTSNPKTYHYHPSTHKYYANVSGEDRRLPVFCYLLNTGSELILVDTGMADSDRANRYHHPGYFYASALGPHILYEGIQQCEVLCPEKGV